MGTTTALGSLDEATGEAECATTQIVHCDSSRELECWWVAKLYADNTVDSRHSQAIHFVTERMNTNPTRSAHRIYTDMWMLARTMPWQAFGLLRDDLAKEGCSVRAERCRLHSKARWRGLQTS